MPGAAQSLGVCANPVARDTGFIKYTESSGSTGMQSFTFKTTQKDAEKTVAGGQSQPSSASALAPVGPAAGSCCAQEPARSLPPPPCATAAAAPPVPPVLAPLAPPPAPVISSAAPVLPPAPVSPPPVENQKIAVLEAVEHPAPPAALPTAADCSVKSPSPASDPTTA